MKLNKLFAICALVLVALHVSANPLSLASVFSDHAVLQRDIAAPIWGLAKPQASINVTIDNDAGIIFDVETVANEKGEWQVKTKPFPAGGPYSITVSTGNDEVVIIDDILFGDVWICSGQSNMEMSYGWGLTRGKKDIENNTYSDIRFLLVPNKTSITPIKSFEASWKICEPESAKHFSAVGYFFGAALKAELPNVPIGLVDVALHSTPIETWLSLDQLGTVSDIRKSVDEYRVAYDEWLQDGPENDELELQAWFTEIDPFGSAKIKPYEVSFDDQKWNTVELPQLFEQHIDPAFDGLVWYRTVIELTDEDAAKPATLSLGTIDNEDVTYVNGIIVGRQQRHDVFRRYDVPEGVLRAGTNVIAIRVLDTGFAGGLTGQSADMKIVFGGTEKSLAQEWRYVASACLTHGKPESFSRPSANLYSACYHGMFVPLFPMAVKGAIWYQGCSNVGNETLYKKIFPAMVEDWRCQLTATELPIYLVQLAAYKATHENPFESAWARMRWAMTELGEMVPHSGTAVAIDVGAHDDIHPKDKKTVGERLARLALHRTYGRTDIVEAGPIPLSAKKTPAGIVVRFKNADGLKTSDGGEISGFQIVDKAEHVIWASAQIGDTAVIVAIPDDFDAAAVRFAWDDFPVCNLVNETDLPCGPFQLMLE